MQAFLLCDSIVRDAQSGKTIIQGVFDTVFAQGVPAIHPMLTAYFRLQFDGPPSEEFTAALAITAPSGLRNVSPSLTLRNIGPSGKTEGWMNLQGLQFRELGGYKFELLLNGEVVGEYKINLQKMGEPISGRQLH